LALSPVDVKDLLDLDHVLEAKVRTVIAATTIAATT
jgi:hypothetical protein